jgi:tetratricopeptide (TPR) repeat protein
MPLAVAVLVLLAATATAVSATDSHAEILNRCDLAGKLIEDGRGDLALEQLKKALDVPRARGCALEQLQALAEPTTGQSRCSAAKQLRRLRLQGNMPDAAKGKLLEAAKAQYEKALESERERACAARGLSRVEELQAERARRAVSPEDAIDAAVDWAGKAWPWALALGLVAAGGQAVRLFLPSKHVFINSAKSDEAFAGAVEDAANAAGGKEAPPAKVMLGGADALPDKTLTDLSKLLQLPAPLSSLLNLVAVLVPSRGFRVSLGWWTAGGWAVASVKLSRPGGRRSLKERIALRSGDLSAEKQQEAVALVAGAWLVTALSSGHQPAPTREGDKLAALAHAYFRAGANLQARSETASALACYAEMPAVDRADAPFAWAGARLNTMMALKAMGRSEEASALADEAADVADKRMEHPADVSAFGRSELEDLRRRTVYLIAILRVDLAAEDPTNGQTLEAACTALAKLAAEIEAATNSAAVDSGLLAAMRMVQICGQLILGSVPIDEEEIDRSLLADLQSSAERTPRPPLSAAAYYDAACAFSLLADRSPNDVLASARSSEMLRLTLAAAPSASHPRVRELAATDPTLAFVRTHHRPAFDEALQTKSDPTPDARIAVTLDGGKT